MRVVFYFVGKNKVIYLIVLLAANPDEDINFRLLPVMKASGAPIWKQKLNLE